MTEPLREQAMSEADLFAAYRSREDLGVLFTPAPELVALLERIAREVTTCRELLELLVDRAEADDRPEVVEVAVEDDDGGT